MSEPFGQYVGQMRARRRLYRWEAQIVSGPQRAFIAWGRTRGAAERRAEARLEKWGRTDGHR